MPLSSQREFFSNKCFLETLRFAFRLYELAPSAQAPELDLLRLAAAPCPGCWPRCWFPPDRQGVGVSSRAAKAALRGTGGRILLLVWGQLLLSLSLQLLLIPRTLAPALF